MSLAVLAFLQAQSACYSLLLSVRVQVPLNGEGQPSPEVPLSEMKQLKNNNIRSAMADALASQRCRRWIMMFFPIETTSLVSKSWRSLKHQQVTRLKPTDTPRAVTDALVVALASSCRNLTAIHLGLTQVTDVGAQAIASSCRNLTTIYLRSTRVTDVGAQALASSCRNLTAIDLYFTQVTDVGAQALASSCRNLTAL